MTSQSVQGYLAALADPEMAGAAVRVAIVVGSLLFTINHGAALAQGKMTQGRWASALLTYCVPYCVSVHGQYTSQQRHANHSVEPPE